MKKTLALLMMCIIVTFGVVLSACSPTNTNHEHSFSDQWEKDATYHWHEATCHPGVFDQKVQHTFGNDNICTECGYVKGTVPSDHVHDKVLTPVEGKEATCTETGLVAHFTCKGCGKLFDAAENGKEVELEDLIIDALGHSIEKIDAKEGTCISEAIIEHYECERCHKFFKDADGKQELSEDMIKGQKNPDNHSLTLHQAKKETCKEDGNIAYYECEYCHKYFETAEGDKELDKEKVIIPLDPTKHGELTHVPEAEGTCSKKGNIEYYHCDLCLNNYKDEDGLEKIDEVETDYELDNHKIKYVAEDPATCEASGLAEHYTCEYCNGNFSDPKGKNKITDMNNLQISALGHSYTNVVSTPDGSNGHKVICRRCNKAKIDENNKEVFAHKMEENGHVCIECGYFDGTGTKPTTGKLLLSNLIYEYDSDSKTAKVVSYEEEGLVNCVIAEKFTLDNIEYTVTEIADNAIYHEYTMEGIKSIVIPQSITKIGKQAFAGWQGLETLVIFVNKQIETSNDSFYSCYNQVKVYFKGTQEEYEASQVSKAWSNYTAWKILYYKADRPTENYDSYWYFADDFNEVPAIYPVDLSWTDLSNGLIYKYYDDGENKTAHVVGHTDIANNVIDLVISSSITIDNESYTVIKIGDNAFKALEKLESVEIPDSVTILGMSAFQGCNALKSVKMSSKITSMGLSVFQDCVSLINIEIPDSVTSIGNYALLGCSSLESVYIGNGLSNLGTNKFNSILKDCIKLSKIDIGKDNEKYTSDGGNCIIEKETNKLIFGCKGSVIPDSVTEISNNAFDGCVGLESIKIPSGVKTVGDYAFQNCPALKTVEISDGVESIGTNAFYKCSELVSITIPKSVTSIKNSAFDSCVKMTSATIGEGVTKLEYNLFKSCAALTKVELKGQITSIGSNVFYYCTGLKSITIPESVTEINNGAFEGCSGLISVTIPDNVTKLVDNAFKDCSGLTSINIGKGITSISGKSNIFSGCIALATITISNDNTKYKSEGNCIIDKSSNTLVLGCKGSEIPDSVTSIDNYAFSGCTGMTTIKIPAKVQSLGDYIFQNCTDLETITFDEGVKSLENYVFSGCTSLESIKFPNSVTNIGNNIFNGCSKLTSVEIGDGLTYLTDKIFAGCSALTTLKLGSGLTTIANSALKECVNLTTLTISESNKTFKSENNCIIDKSTNKIVVGCKGSTIPTNATSIGDYAFQNCTDLTSITIPEGVTSIGQYAFDGCKGLVSISIPDGVTSLGNYAFQNCTALVSVTIPSSVTSIGNYAFKGCTTLDKVDIADQGLSTIGEHAFDGCYLLNEIKIPKTVTSIGQYAFNGCKGLTEIEIPKTVPSIGNYAFSGCSGLTSIKINEGVTSIGNYAFNGCTALTQLTIPNSVLAINDNAFSGCSGLTNITLGSGVTTIGKNVFNQCSGLTQIIIPDSVTSIGDSAFNSCTGLTSLQLGSGLTTIGKTLFSGCTNLTTLTMSNESSKYRCEGNCLIEKSTNGSSDKVVLGCKGSTIPNTVTSIGEKAFDGCSALVSITIPANVTTIGKEAFNNCKGLESVEINKGVTTIEQNAFYNCSNLKSIVIPDSVTTISNSVFYGCGLTSIVLPDSVTSLGNSVFNGCTGLESIVIGNGVASIGTSVFSRCSSLTKIVIGSKIKDIGNSAFSGCNKLSEVYYRGNESEWKNVKVGTGNTFLTNATMYYYSDQNPKNNGDYNSELNYWHYDGNNIVIWEK